MLELIFTGILGWIIIYSIGQLVVVAAFVRAFRVPRDRVRNIFSPKTAILVAIRGPDPSLERNIRALVDQDYPAYKLFIVVDHVEDAAWPIVDRICAEMPERIQISSLKEPLRTCSLKCSALVQAVTELDASYEVVAFADGDSAVHRSWLRELVEPLVDPKVGVSTGSRWYLPDDSGLGSMTRYLWNAGAAVQIWLNGFAWPGSMAMRTEVLKDTGIVSAWRKSLFDGPAVVRCTRHAGYKVRLVPSVVIVNRERITLADFSSWVERQAVVARSLGSDWYILAAHSANIAICALAPLVVLLPGWSNPGLLRWALAAAVSYWGVTLLSVLMLQQTFRRALVAQGDKTPWFGRQKALAVLPSVVLVHFVVLRAFVYSTRQTKVDWRGIAYEIRGPDDVQLLNYAPFRQTTTEPDESVI